MYEFSWEAVKSDEEMLYTLVCIGESDDNVTRYSIKAVKGNEDLKVYVGKSVISSGGYTYTWDDDIAKGIKHFILYVTFPDGYMICSNVLTINFDEVSQNP